MRVLIACEYSGRTRRAFEARGHEVWSCDLLPAEDEAKNHIVGDVFDVIRDHGPFDLMIAHPPCTYLANSGVRWLRERKSTKHGDEWVGFNRARYLQMLYGADFFAKLLAGPIPKIAVENPIMHRYGRERIEKFLTENHLPVLPTHFVQPWWFGDPAFKATGFTLKGLEPLAKPASALVPPKPGTPEHKAWSVIHNASPGPDRWKDRSRTFPGIANAMAATWG